MLDCADGHTGAGDDIARPSALLLDEFGCNILEVVAMFSRTSSFLPLSLPAVFARSPRETAGSVGNAALKGRNIKV